MTPSELTRLRGVCEKATPGKWERVQGTIFHHDSLVCTTNEFGNSTENRHFSNAIFIAEARTAMPKLIDELQFYMMDNDNLKAEVERLDKLNEGLQLTMKSGELLQTSAKMLIEENARLTAENESLRKERDQHRHVYNKNRKDLLESNARLREALEKISEDKDDYGYDCLVPSDAAKIAREALGGGG